MADDEEKIENQKPKMEIEGDPENIKIKEGEPIPEVANSGVKITEVSGNDKKINDNEVQINIPIDQKITISQPQDVDGSESKPDTPQSQTDKALTSEKSTPINQTKTNPPPTKKPSHPITGKKSTDSQTSDQVEEQPTDHEPQLKENESGAKEPTEENNQPSDEDQQPDNEQQDEEQADGNPEKVNKNISTEPPKANDPNAIANEIAGNQAIGGGQKSVLPTGSQPMEEDGIKRADQTADSPQAALPAPASADGEGGTPPKLPTTAKQNDAATQIKSNSKATEKDNEADTQEQIKKAMDAVFETGAFKLMKRIAPRVANTIETLLRLASRTLDKAIENLKNVKNILRVARQAAALADAFISYFRTWLSWSVALWWWTIIGIIVDLTLVLASYLIIISIFGGRFAKAVAKGTKTGDEAISKLEKIQTKVDKAKQRARKNEIDSAAEEANPKPAPAQ